MDSRPGSYHSDLNQLRELVLAYRVATDVRRYPTWWRVRLLLTSRVWEPALDTRVWETADGRIAGLAFLWRRKPTTPYLVLERFAHPAFATESLVTEMLQWGYAHTTEIVAAQKIPLTLYANAVTLPDCADDAFTLYGFTPTPSDPTDTNVYFTRSLPSETPAVALANDYTIRPLQSLAELEAYQKLYGFAAVNAEHQRELFESDEYTHLVIVGPQGDFLAYCEVSICRAEWELSGQRLGWVDYIETKPEQRQHGLGRAILYAGLNQLRAWGAETAMLVTVSSNTAAMRLYERTGFERVAIAEPPSYQKQFA
jgi:ribosomal protein S18 acetylase RimI-like enzyme